MQQSISPLSLITFLLLSACGGPTYVEEGNSKPGIHSNWSAKESIHPQTEKRSGSVRIASENRVRFTGKKILLSVNCYSSGSIDLVVDWKYVLNLRDSKPLEVFLDSEKAVSFATIASNRGRYQIIRNAEKMITLLWSEQPLKLRSTDLKGISTGMANFDIAGFRSAWAEGCFWHDNYDAEKGYVNRI